MNSWIHALTVAVLPLQSLDVEALLSSIEAVPAIYDTRHPKHNDRNYINTQWSMIADALGINGKYLMKYSMNNLFPCDNLIAMC